MKKLSLAGAALLSGLVLFSFLSTPEVPRPNILVIVADDAGLDMSAYGRSWVSTPAFDRIAREGVLFNRAYTPNAKCAPSRSCLLTGRNSWQLDAAANHVIYFPTKFKTYAEALAAHGYATGYTGKGYAPGKALHEDGSPRALLGKAYDRHQTTPPAQFISNNDYAANFADFLGQVPGGQPWTFWLGFHEPHRDYEYGAGIRKGGKRLDMISKVPSYWPDSTRIRTDLLDYAYEIEYMDAHVARVLETLEKSGQLENTLVVFTSDHGMPFPRVKGNQYEHANHVPMALMWKNGLKSTGRKIDDYVSFVDLAPTFLEIAGLNWQKSGMQPAAGKSLLPILQSSKNGQVEAARDFVLVGQERHDVGRPNDEGYPIRGLHKNGMLYLKNYETSRWPVCNPETGYLNCDGSPTKTLLLNLRRNGVDTHYWALNFGKRPAEELYDLRKDPDCVKNLATTPAYRPTIQKLRTEMETRLRAEGDLRMSGYGYLYEQYPVTELRNFYERFMNGEKLTTGWVNDSDYEKEKIED
ncbi:sulfatase [Rhabdobacter roseus]|uniref:Arylsulfatase A-like enzyme n=1 Tax=Rhabdobacter roseus TaxID=1655419 RepID=A0A840THD9_9BACT|nr:sulfatase [Rhabdobacter roseus]MBB5282874.1 arylsulfatase A-like enzyme [Rhabdobacter roseus]